MCPNRPNYGYAPPVASTPVQVQVTGLRRSSDSTWRITVALRLRDDPSRYRFKTTVEKYAGHYRVCTAEVP